MPLSRPLSTSQYFHIFSGVAKNITWGMAWHSVVFRRTEDSAFMQTLRSNHPKNESKSHRYHGVWGVHKLLTFGIYRGTLNCS